MVLVDSHCHLQSKAFDADRQAVLERASEVLKHMVVVGDTVASSNQAVAMAGPHVSATAGIHPHNAAELDDRSSAALEDFAAHHKVAAWGEIGLDYYYDHAPHDVQRAAFTRQLALAAKWALPVIIHCRDAYADITAILDEYHEVLSGGVMHCFSGDAAFLERCLGWGLHVSFAGNVTFKKADGLRDVAKAAPLDRLLVETDSPYLAPQPVRGKRCEPAFVIHTARFLAELRGEPFDDFARQTSANARRLLGLDLEVPGEGERT